MHMVWKPACPADLLCPQPPTPSAPPQSPAQEGQINLMHQEGLTEQGGEGMLLSTVAQLALQRAHKAKAGHPQCSGLGFSSLWFLNLRAKLVTPVPCQWIHYTGIWYSVFLLLCTMLPFSGWKEKVVLFTQMKRI